MFILIISLFNEYFPTYLLLPEPPSRMETGTVPASV